METYYVNNHAQANGDHEVHKKNCVYFPSNTTILGTYPSCEGAVKAAKVYYSTADGCKTCSPACHKR